LPIKNRFLAGVYLDEVGQELQEGHRQYALLTCSYKIMKEYQFVVYRLQKLSILLRILSFDVLYFQDEDYIAVINLAKRTHRILLSRVKFLRKLVSVNFSGVDRGRLPWIF